MRRPDRGVDSDPLAGLRLAATFFRVSALNELQYRTNLVIQVFQSLIALGTGLAVLGLVFSQTSDLNGWTPSELLAVMGVHVLMGGLIATVVQPPMERLMVDIRRGTLDFVLTKPADAQVLVAVRELRIWSAVDVVVGLVVLAIAVAQRGGGLGPWQVGAFIAALVVGTTLIWCFWMLLTIAAFWVVRIDELAELFDGIYQSGRWPVTVYPGWLQVTLTFLVPIAFAVTVPAEALTDRLTPDTLGVALAFAVILGAATRAFWRFGLRQYSGASA
jgi:ABC-2 type transport system permease protein